MFKRLFIQRPYILCLAGFLAVLPAAQDCAADNAASAGAKQAADSAQGQKLHLKELRLNVSENDLAHSDDFAYFAAGHFGDKTQYMGRIPDEYGGAYAVHCRQGKPFSIEVKYQGKGIERDAAMQVMQRLLPADAGALTEHDDDDIKKMDAPQAAEFFYYKTGPRSELLYANGSNKRVVQVNVWTKNG